MPEYCGEQKEFSPEEISSMILLKIKETAESYLDTTTNNAVITSCVAAQFSLDPSNGMGVVLCSDSGPFDFRDPCVRSSWSVLLPALLVFALCLFSLPLPTQLQHLFAILARPFRTYLTLDEAETLDADVTEKNKGDAADSDTTSSRSGAPSRSCSSGSQSRPVRWGDSAGGGGRCMIMRCLGRGGFPPGELSVITARLERLRSWQITLLPSSGGGGGQIIMSKDPYHLDAHGLAHAISYTAQAPWLRHQSTRDNILFGAPLEEERYGAVVEACALGPDLGVLEDGDAMEIGARGVSLSGGGGGRKRVPPSPTPPPRLPHPHPSSLTTLLSSLPNTTLPPRPAPTQTRSSRSLVPRFGPVLASVTSTSDTDVDTEVPSQTPHCPHALPQPQTRSSRSLVPRFGPVLASVTSTSDVDVDTDDIDGAFRNLLRIINEPTMAAIAYGLDKFAKVCSRVEDSKVPSPVTIGLLIQGLGCTSRMEEVRYAYTVA
ncbi:hypothetical protein D9615_007536 [Tricholomella constricta]|uniref:Uncharacterized protein n=1 Tax=Tricholomella constricta TaxID=117010 RepID=A0A8H5H7S6_9AGAR|nr:hypothetical protein D9615_007536 [Tricholomella constricta]